MVFVSNMVTTQQYPAEPTLFRAEDGAVHGFAHYLNCKRNGSIDINVILVVLLQKTLRGSVVRADTCRLPTAVVPRRIGVV